MSLQENSVKLAASQRYKTNGNQVFDGDILVHTFTNGHQPNASARDYADYLNRTSLMDAIPYEHAIVIVPHDWTPQRAITAKQTTTSAGRGAE